MRLDGSERHSRAGYAVGVLLATRYYGLTGAAIAVAACLVVQFAILEPAERSAVRRARPQD